MNQQNLIADLKKRGFALHFKENDADTTFCNGCVFPKDPPFEENEAVFAKHRDFIRTLTKGDWFNTHPELTQQVGYARP